MGLYNWGNSDLFSVLRDKYNAISTALSGGTIGQIWTKDSSTDFAGTFKNAQTVVYGTLPSRTGNKRKALVVTTDETGYELDSGTTGFVDIPTGGTGLITIGTATYTTLNDGAGTPVALSVTLPNDNKTRKFLIIAFMSYENGGGQTSRIFTRIARSGTALATGFKDLRAAQSEFQIQYLGSILCTGQVISIDARLQDAGVDSACSFNGGSISIAEIL